MNLIETQTRTPDGFELDVVIRMPSGEAKKTVIMSHGLTSYKDGRRGQLQVIAEALCNAGYKVIQYDFRGHGKSSGNDMDVTPTSLKTDLETIINTFVSNGDYYLFGFSFGGFAVCKYLFDTQNTTVKKVVLVGPPLDPINSSLLNPKEFCQPEIQAAIDNGDLERKGYAYWSSKSFRISKKFIDECREFDYKSAIAALTGRTLLIQGRQDNNVDRDYNVRFADEYGLTYKEYDASHSLWQVIDDAAKVIVDYFDN
jgi:pimeloyl-ACP methyl ester carboxylesterase